MLLYLWKSSKWDPEAHSSFTLRSVWRGGKAHAHTRPHRGQPCGRNLNFVWFLWGRFLVEEPVTGSTKQNFINKYTAWFFWGLFIPSSPIQELTLDPTIWSPHFAFTLSPETQCESCYFFNMSRKQWKSHRIEGLKALFLYCLYNTDQLWITKLISRISLFAVSLVYHRSNLKPPSPEWSISGEKEPKIWSDSAFLTTPFHVGAVEASSNARILIALITCSNTHIKSSTFAAWHWLLLNSDGLAKTTLKALSIKPKKIGTERPGQG